MEKLNLPESKKRLTRVFVFSITELHHAEFKKLEEKIFKKKYCRIDFFRLGNFLFFYGMRKIKGKFGITGWINPTKISPELCSLV